MIFWVLPTCPEISPLPFWVLNIQPSKDIGSSKACSSLFCDALIGPNIRLLLFSDYSPMGQHKFILLKSRKMFITLSVVWELGLSMTQNSTIYTVLNTMRIFLLKSMFKTDILMKNSKRKQVVLLIPILLFFDGRLSGFGRLFPLLSTHSLHLVRMFTHGVAEKLHQNTGF